ncbi:MAG: oxidoreductase [Acidimicrobiaceae bacterium]|nr:MAG: oxidoreductase [Acidimicrobiaceae bacterium]
MEVRDKLVVVTGAASGIGAACAGLFAAEAARRVVCADLDESGARTVARRINEALGRDLAVGMRCDVGQEDSVRSLIDEVGESDGVIDLYFANAGVASLSDPLTADEVWERAWRVNTMAHVWAARHLLPAWLDRGEGYLVTTASIGGILTALGDAAYTTTKHAAVGFAEWMAITYGDRGVRVSCLCPAGVSTPLLAVFTGVETAKDTVLRVAGDVMQPDEAARRVVAGIRDEATLILTHPEMQVFMERKVSDHGRWIGGMIRQWRLQREAQGPAGP